MKSYLRTAALVSGWFLTGLVIGAVLVFLFILGGCAGAGQALNAAGAHGTQLGFGAAVGLGAAFLGLPGLLAFAAAGVGGALAAIMSTPAVVAAGEAQAGFPWGVVIVIVVAVLALRAWAHWGPAAVRLLSPLVKTSSRALLGGINRKSE